MATYNGNDGGNIYTGTAALDQIYGHGGDDILKGAGGDDYIDGGADNDHISGGAGNDTLNGGTGDDVISANGADTIDGGTGNDIVDFAYRALVGGTIDGGADDDTLEFDGATFGPSSGSATFSGFEHIADHSTLRGTSGNDAIDLSGITSLQSDPVNFRILGGAGDDTITGGVESDHISGGAGNDTLDGGGGNDVISADGADKIHGGAGDDVVDFAYHARVGGTIDGGVGDDTLEFDHATFGPSSGSATFTGFEYIADHSTLHGTPGNDAIDLSGITSLKANPVDFRIAGGAGDDIITGGAESDHIRGGPGDDTLSGGAGRDILSGGAGADRFEFATGDTGSTPATADLILDFSSAEHDQIVLSAMDANTNADGDQAFTFIGTAVFSHHAGELRYSVGPTACYVSGDVNGDGVADFYIKVSHFTSLSAGDFLL